MSVNQCTFIGNVGKDPEIKTFPNGGKVANFSIAVSEKWKDRTSGEQKERTEWINIAVKNDGLVGVVERFIKKGSKLYVQGQFQTRKWQDQSGNDRYSTEIVVQGFTGKIEMLDGKPQGERSGGSSGGGSRGGGGGYAGSGSGGSAGSSFDDELNDDVPFGTCDPALEQRHLRRVI